MFSNKKQIDVELADQTEVLLSTLINHLEKNYLNDKKEMFIQSNTVRPGIIVLINDTDWELLDTDKYIVQNGDNITFISTLHGG